MGRTAPKPKTRQSWRNQPDSLLLRNIPPTLHHAESLCPSPKTVIAAASGVDVRAKAIIEAWAIRYPVTLV